MTENNGEGTNNRHLYALLHVSPQASDEEIRRAYRQWAQVYHPDKYQSPRMKEIATENFQRVCEAYEILTDENKRIIYDIYGMEGLLSGLELGPKLDKVNEIKEELERLRRQREREKASPSIQSSGSIIANLSWPDLLDGDGIMRGMAMATEVQSQLSKRTSLAIGGNLAVSAEAGGGAATAILRHHVSPVSSVELVGSIGLQSLIGVQISRQLSVHSTAVSGITMSLRDGSMNLSNSWTRQLSETTSGNIQLSLGNESSIGVGWRKKEQKLSASGEIKIGTSSFGATANVTHLFSSKSHGRIAGTFGSDALAIEIGGGRKISNFSTIRMLYSIGIQGLIWRFELHRGGQKLVIPHGSTDGHDGEGGRGVNRGDVGVGGAAGGRHPVSKGGGQGTKRLDSADGGIDVDNNRWRNIFSSHRDLNAENPLLASKSAEKSVVVSITTQEVPAAMAYAQRLRIELLCFDG